MIRVALSFIFLISVSCNIYCLIDYYHTLQGRIFTDAIINNSKIKDLSLDEGSSFLFKKVKDLHPEYEKTKKYYFISLWNIMCKPCIKEMPLLDSLANNINRNDFAYIYVTENGDKLINQFKQRHKISSKKFIFINDADVYISAILKNNKIENRQYPIQLIIDNLGNLLHFQVGTISNSKDSLVMSSINKLSLAPLHL
jgi:thiol-disulfide isomerase/thioredoxin